MNFKKLGLLIGASTLLGSSSAFANLTINPIYDSTITNDANAATIINTITQAMGFYQTHILDNIQVTLKFSEGGGLGSSSQGFIGVSYTDFHNALIAHATTANDTIALAHLATQTNEPVTGLQSTVALSKANARVLGLYSGAGVDCSIGLNTSICNLVHGVNTNGGFYDLFGVTCHEIDEALGTVSFDGSTLPSSADMFRYNAGVRSFDTLTTHKAFFSIDGTTNIVEYNQLSHSNGDWGDWIHHNGAPQVQDWSATPGTTVDIGNSETTLLDVVGYNYSAAPVPEPSVITGIGLGAVALIRRRKK